MQIPSLVDENLFSYLKDVLRSPVQLIFSDVLGENKGKSNNMIHKHHSHSSAGQGW